MNDAVSSLAMQAGRMFAFEWNPVTDEVRRSADCAEIFGLNGRGTREKGKDSLRRIHPENREGLIRLVEVRRVLDANQRLVQNRIQG